MESYTTNYTNVILVEDINLAAVLITAGCRSLDTCIAPKGIWGKILLYFPCSIEVTETIRKIKTENELKVNANELLEEYFELADFLNDVLSAYKRDYDAEHIAPVAIDSK